MKSKTTVRLTCAVPPSALTATTFSTVVPPVTATATLKAPSAAAVVEALVVAKSGVRVGGGDVDGVARRRRAAHRDGRADHGAQVGRAGDGERRRALRVRDVTLERVRPAGRPAARRRCRRTTARTDAADQVSGRRRARRLAVDEADRGDFRRSAEWRSRQIRAVPVLLGNEADAAGEPVHAVEQGRGAGRVPGLRAIARRARTRAPARRARYLGPTAPTGGRRSRGPRSRRRCSGASRSRSACSSGSSRPRRAATRGCPDRSRAARRDGRARGSRRRSPTR